MPVDRHLVQAAFQSASEEAVRVGLLCMGHGCFQFPPWERCWEKNRCGRAVENCPTLITDSALTPHCSGRKQPRTDKASGGSWKGGGLKSPRVTGGFHGGKDGSG